MGLAMRRLLEGYGRKKRRARCCQDGCSQPLALDTAQLAGPLLRIRRSGSPTANLRPGTGTYLPTFMDAVHRGHCVGGASSSRDLGLSWAVTMRASLDPFEIISVLRSTVVCAMIAYFPL